MHDDKGVYSIPGNSYTHYNWVVDGVLFSHLLTYNYLEQCELSHSLHNSG